jgi:hypothetical protein
VTTLVVMSIDLLERVLKVKVKSQLPNDGPTGGA